MRLTIVRHGETEHNRGQLTLGRADVPLNELGRRQAHALGQSFDAPPAAIYSSPLRRALDTAQAIAVPHKINVVVERNLIEMDVGEMEHLSYQQLRDRYPEFLREWMSEAAGDARMPGGETLVEVQERAWSAIERLGAQHPDGDVVVVTHNFVALVVVCRAVGLPVWGFRAIRQALAAKTVIDFGERGATLLQLNDVSHLLIAGLPTGVSRTPGS